MKIIKVHEITVTYLETPADIGFKTLNIAVPSAIDIDKENLMLFITVCLKIEIFAIESFNVTEVHDV